MKSFKSLVPLALFPWIITLPCFAQVGPQGATYKVVNLTVPSEKDIISNEVAGVSNHNGDLILTEYIVICREKDKPTGQQPQDGWKYKFVVLNSGDGAIVDNSIYTCGI